jgi:hypothetical protein
MLRSLTILVGAGLVLLPRVAAAQAARFEFVGPNRCLNCHDHGTEKAWFESKELLEVKRLFPEKGANAGHINSMTQLDAAKSDAFAKAVGLADKYDVNGACVKCHATVYSGEANAGVSCESCHGPGSGYLQPHQTKGSYDLAVSQYGMTRLIGNMQGWIQQCTNCHVMDDDRLIKAGHPSGDDFDLSKKFAPVSLHFKKTYAAADVDTVAKSAMAGIINRRRPGAAPVAPIATLPPEPAVAAPPPPPPPPPTGGTTAPRTTAPRRAPQALAINPAAPPAGSPTSIEPPPPIGAAPPPPPPAAAAPPSASVPAAADDSTSFLTTNWPWLTAVVLIGIGALVFLRRRR